MGGMIPKRVFSREKGGQTPRENQFSFSNAKTTKLMDFMFNFLNHYLVNLKFYLLGHSFSMQNNFFFENQR